MDPNNPDTNTDMNNNKPMMGGRRKGHKTRKEPNVLKSWRKFVRKVQHEEHLTYPKAMKRASQRKSEWQRGGATNDDNMDTSMDSKMAPSMEPSMSPKMAPSMSMPGMSDSKGGRRRRRSRKQRGGDEMPQEEKQYGGDGEEQKEQEGGRRKRSRRQRGGNAPASSSAPASVADFDENWKQYGSVGGSRKRRHRR